MNTTTIKVSLVLTDDGSVDVEATYAAAKAKIDAEALWAGEGFEMTKLAFLSVAEKLDLTRKPLGEKAVIQAVMTELGQTDPFTYSENVSRAEEVLESLKGDFNENHKPLRSVRGPGGGLSLWTDSSRKTAEVAAAAKAEKARKAAAKV